VDTPGGVEINENIFVLILLKDSRRRNIRKEKDLN
jgi:hypothetical protein